MSPNAIPGGAQSKPRSIGDLETVVVEEELTLDNIKKACALKFSHPVERCVIFKINRGPNVQNLVQLNLKKNIYCLFRSMQGKPDEDQDAEEDENLLDEEMSKLKKTTAKAQKKTNISLVIYPVYPVLSCIL